jgi:hypothetical protein
MPFINSEDVCEMPKINGDAADDGNALRRLTLIWLATGPLRWRDE